jgi:hypothetical protein
MQIAGTFTASNFSGSSSGTNTGDETLARVNALAITTVGTIGTGVWNGTTIAIANGGTGGTTAATARTNLGLAIGTDVLAYRTFGTAANSATGDFAPAAGSTSVTTLGTIATGVWNGTTIAIANGGTGGTTAATARTNLGLAIGSDVLAYRTFGTIANSATGDYATYNATHYVGTTAIAANRASASQTLTGVSIDGNAATVTNATFYRQFTVRDDRSDGGNYNLSGRATGLYAIESSGSNGPGSGYLSLIHVANGTDVAFQIAGGYTSDNMYFRGTSALQNGTGYSSWRTVIHSGNIASQTVTYASGETLATVTNRGASTTGAITVNGTLTGTSTVAASGGASGGFLSSTYSSGYNRIWAFGNALAYGFGYYQGGTDYIGFHFGATGSPQYIFYQTGNMSISGVFTENSSIRYKKDIETVKYGLDKVLQMRGVTYIKKDTGLKEIGVIEEVMNEIVPEVIIRNEEGLVDAVSYSRLSAVFIEAIKELKQEINEQNLIISELKSKLDQ